MVDRATSFCGWTLHEPGAGHDGELRDGSAVADASLMVPIGNLWWPASITV
jgi:hypothetical protein